MAKKKNILFIFKLPPPVNGATIANETIFKSEKVYEFFNPHFINYGLSKSSKEFGAYSLKKIWIYIFSIIELFRILIFENIKVVYITVAPGGLAFFKDSVFIILSKLFFKKIIVHLHGKGIKRFASRNIFIKLYYKFIFGNTSVICLSERLLSDVDFLKCRQKFVIPNGINLDSFVKGSSYIRDIPVILYLSNLYNKKGIPDFVEAIRHLIQKGVNFEAWIVGNSTYDLTIEELKEKILKEKLDKYIKVLGPKYGKDKMDVFNNANIFLFPTRWPNEAFPISIIEAMYSGLPIISTNEGGIPDMVEDGINGFIVDNKDYTKIAELLEKLIKDKFLYEVISNRNVEKVERFYTQDLFLVNIINAIKIVLNETTNTTT